MKPNKKTVSLTERMFESAANDGMGPTEFSRYVVSGMSAFLRSRGADKQQVRDLVFDAVQFTLKVMAAGVTDEIRRENLPFIAPVTQFLLPDGRKRDSFAFLPDSCKQLYDSMKFAGYSLESEILSDGMVATSISDSEAEIDIDVSITPNGPEVINGIVAMLERKQWEKSPNKK